jgi:hypothetical protein
MSSELRDATGGVVPDWHVSHMGGPCGENATILSLPYRP